MKRSQNNEQLPPGAERIFDMGLDLLAINKELVTALDASTKNLRTLEEIYRDYAPDTDPRMIDLIRANCEANELTLRRARGEQIADSPKESP